jgi:hypothetical protein
MWGSETDVVITIHLMLQMWIMTLQPSSHMGQALVYAGFRLSFCDLSSGKIFPGEAHLLSLQRGRFFPASKRVQGGPVLR